MRLLPTERQTLQGQRRRPDTPNVCIASNADKGGPLWRPRAPQRFSTSFLVPPNSLLQLLQLTVRLGNRCGHKILTRPPSSPVDSKNATTNPLTIDYISSRAPIRPRRPRSAWRGWKMARLWRPRSASSRAQSASSRGGGNKASSNLVISVTDLVQHGEDMKSGLARPLENYFCLGFNFQSTHSTSKLASSTRKALKSFWGMIPTNSTARPHHITSKNKRNQGQLPKISAAHGNCQRHSRRQEQQAHPSAKPATSAANSRHV